ncbi:MAG: helix-turn-helix transcriptional regulator [Proteobacteria bacterium]|nr:helix-turn-helix transcriptional regulator [Pseudomonadota bacterium]
MAPLGEMIEAIYASPVDGSGWRDVMQLLRARFGSNMEALYFLDTADQRMRIVELQGVTPVWLERFDAAYFLADNPWVHHASWGQQPGAVRTGWQLAEYTGDADVLRRSTYFNEWMRPQHFEHIMGVTSYAQDGVIANISMFRPPDMPRFDDGLIREMQALTPHIQRAFGFCMRLESATQSERLGLALLDTLAEGFALVDGHGHLHHANPVLEGWLRTGDLLEAKAGRLQARAPTAAQQLTALIADTALGLAPHPGGVDLAGPGGRVLNAKAMPVRGANLRYLPPRTYVLLMFSEPRADDAARLQQAGERYRLTRAEQRLALHLAAGTSLRDAAERCGIGYGTARGYLKLLFQKTGTHRQGELVALLLGREQPG